MTILTKQPPAVETELTGDDEGKSFLDESLVRQVLFSERKKQVVAQPSKELSATKKLLKALISEAWDEIGYSSQR